MRRVWLLLIAASECFGAITNLRQIGSTPREIIIAYTAPGPGACPLNETSESPSYSPVVNDVNTVLYPGSASDARNGVQAGRERTFVIGAAGTGIKYAPIDSTGARSSRALQAFTLHYIRVTCPNPAGGNDTATLIARTANIATGDTYPTETTAIDPASPGESAWPDFDWNDRTPRIDPVSGVLLTKFPYVNHQRYNPAGSYYPVDHAYDPSGNWVNKNNALVEDGAVATFTGSTNDPLILTSDSYDLNINQNGGRATGLTLRLKAFVDNASTTLSGCWTMNGVSCYGPYIALSAPPVGALGAYTYSGDPDIYKLPNSTTDMAPGATPTVAMFSAWLSPHQKIPYMIARSGRANNVGAALTLYNNDASDGLQAAKGFGPYWVAGTPITYNGVDTTVASNISGTELTIAATPPSNLTAALWKAHSVGFLIKKTSVAGTVSIDAAAFEYATYEVPILGGGSGGNKQCTKNSYPEGWTVGVYNNSDGATNTAPIRIHTGQNHDFVTGDQVKVIQVRGNTAANGIWTVNVVDANHVDLVGSDGTASGAFPNGDSSSPTSIRYLGGGLIFKVNAARGHLCWMTDSGTRQPLFWINDKANPVDIRFLGPTYLNGNIDFVSGFSMLFDEGDSDVPSAYSVVQMYAAPNKHELIKGYYKGNETNGMFRDVGPDRPSGLAALDTAIWGWVRLSPTPSSFEEQINAFAGQTVPVMGIDRIVKPGILALSVHYSQNSLAWMGVFNTNTNSVDGLMNSWSNDNYRYLGLHTAEFWEGTDYYSIVPYQLHGGDHGNTPYNGPYRVTLTSNIASTGSDCAALFTSVGIANVSGASGSICSEFTVDKLTPTSPPDVVPFNDTLGGTQIKIGDYLGVEDGTFVGGLGNSSTQASEFLRVVGIGGTGGLHIIGTRDALPSGANYPTAVGPHTSGTTAYEFGGFKLRYWNYAIAPHGTNGADPYQTFSQASGMFNDIFPDESHVFGHGSIYVNDATLPVGLTPPFTCAEHIYYGQPYGVRNYPWPNHVNAPTSAYGCTDGNPTFDTGFGGEGFGQHLEKHPSYVDNQTLSPSFFDCRPYNTDFTALGTLTKVGTYIYKKTGYWAVSALPTFDQKRQRVHMTSGAHTIREISGPGVMLTDTVGDNYKGCVTYVAGECFAGSSVGDAYMNAPRVAPAPANDNADGTRPVGTYGCHLKNELFTDFDLNDACITMQPAYEDQMVQYSTINDPTNAGARRITSAFHAARQTNLLWGTALMPDANYAMAFSYRYKDSYGPLLMLAKIPPYMGPQLGVNRSSFIPIPLTKSDVPRSTATAYVRFGYNTSMYCKERQEVCVANGAGIQTGNSVFSYETSDAPAGLACSSGCTITVPALSQRVMFYQWVYKKSGGTIIATGPVEVLTTP